MLDLNPLTGLYCLCLAWSADNLDVDIFNFISFESSVEKFCMHHFEQFIIDNVPVRIVHSVVEMYVPETVDIEICLVIGTGTFLIKTEFAQFTENIVYGCDCHGCFAVV